MIEVCLAQVRLNVSMLLSPLIPKERTLLDQKEVVLICHVVPS